MAKPRHQHPGLSIMEESPQGQFFLTLWQSALGEDPLRYSAIEALPDGTHVFLVAGSRGWATLVQRKSVAQGNEWYYRWGMLFEPSWSPVSWQLELTAYRWDPFLQAEVNGDATVRDSPPRKRRRITRALRAEGGARKDWLRLRVSPCDRPLMRVAGIPREVVDRVLDKHGMRGGVGTQVSY